MTEILPTTKLKNDLKEIEKHILGVMRLLTMLKGSFSNPKDELTVMEINYRIDDLSKILNWIDNLINKVTFLLPSLTEKR